MEYNNKKITVSGNKNVILPLIILSNLFPLYGVINYNWTIFSIVYLYWIELLIISFFQILKILLAKGDNTTTFGKISIALKFFLIRSGLFLFYLLFIFVFLGFLASDKEDGGKGAISMLEVMFLRGSFYRITLLSFVFYNLVEFLVLFILNGNYKTAKPEDNFIILDVHILVVHIVVVLGTFLYKGAIETMHWNHKSAMIACVSLFVVVKIIADIIRQGLSGNPEDQTGKYI